MIAERWYAVLMVVFLFGWAVGDLGRRAIEAEKRRRDRRTLRAVERSLRQSSRSPW